MFKKMNTALLGLALSMGMTSVHAEEAKKVDVLLMRRRHHERNAGCLAQ